MSRRWSPLPQSPTGGQCCVFSLEFSSCCFFSISTFTNIFWLFFFIFRRNKHGVPQEKIAQMLDRFSFPISVDIVMNSQEPPHVNRRHRQWVVVENRLKKIEKDLLLSNHKYRKISGKMYEGPKTFEVGTRFAWSENFYWIFYISLAEGHKTLHF